MLKKFLSPSNLIFIVLIAFFLVKQSSTMARNMEQEGAKLGKLELITSESKKLSLPPTGRAIAIFWSTTCAPCKVEMARLKSSVEAGKIPKESLLAINAFDSEREIMKFLDKNDYPFTFINSPGLGRALNVQVTPTTMFLDAGKIVSMSSGMSIFGIWKAESFIDK